MASDFNHDIISEFRTNGGRVGGVFDGARLLLLTTIGVRTGTPHTTPVGHLPDEDRVLVIASAAGAPRHPDWFHNLVAHPRVTVEDGVFTYEADATVLTGQERNRMFARAVESDPGWAEYQARTARVIPVVALREVPGPPNFNGASPRRALNLIHDAFRRELSIIRTEVAESGPGLGAQLRVNCLTLCQGLHHHHHGEDTGMFPYFAENHPELEPALERLRREHESVAALLAQLRTLLAAADTHPSRLLADIDRLIGELEEHLTYEEEQLIPLLDPLAADT